MLKKLIILSTAFTCFLLFQYEAQAQEQYGNTFNIGLGIGGHSGYSGYVNRALPVLSINYEIGIIENFTLAPIISIYGYSNNYFYNGRNYRYRETVIPVGLKGTYYFDQLLGAGNKWDFYAASSFGYVIVSSNWEQDFNGNRDFFNNNNVPVFIDIHFGAEYRLTNKLGMFLDVSTGFTSFGISFHN